MMPAISLASYTVRIAKRRAKGFLNLGSFEKGQDLLDLFQEYFKLRMKSASLNEQSKKMLEVVKANRKGREITGALETGEWGSASPIKDVRKRITTHHKTTEEAEKQNPK